MSFRFNPITGKLDLVNAASAASADNFSYVNVPDGSTVTVPSGQQMLFDAELTIDGELVLDGEASAIVNYTEWAFGWNLIPADVSLFVASMRDFLFTDSITIDGHVTLDGRMVEVS